MTPWGGSKWQLKSTYFQLLMLYLHAKPILNIFFSLRIYTYEWLNNTCAVTDGLFGLCQKWDRKSRSKSDKTYQKLTTPGKLIQLPNQIRENSDKQSISVLIYNLLLKGWQPPRNQKSKLNLWYCTYNFISRGSFSSAAEMPNYHSNLCGLYKTNVFL